MKTFTKNVAILLTVVCIFFPLYTACASSTGMKATASSSEGEDLKPENAIDGNMSTRWSSNFSDPQWLQIDLGVSREIVGLTLHWETAYGKAYDILLSEDGNKWTKVYGTVEGDGKTDDVYFQKMRARFVKIYGTKRGTGWGYSLYEVKIKGPNEGPAIIASLSREKYGPANVIMDGRPQTMWKTGENKGQWVQIDLRHSKEIGGLFLYWDKNYACKYEILTSEDGKEWQHLFQVENGNGKKDRIYIRPTRARFLKIKLLKSATGKGYALKEIELKGSDEKLTPLKQFELLAEESPPGYFPMWLTGEQAYWTVVGVSEDQKEILFSEDGSIELDRECPSIMPYLYVEGKFITRNEATVDQSLEKDYLPIPSVTWRCSTVNLTIKTFAWGQPGQSAVFVRYRVQNSGNKSVKGKLFLTVRPFQVTPPWQLWGRGGLAKVNKIAYREATSTLKVNDTKKIVLLNSLHKVGVCPLEKTDVIGFVSKGNLPSQTAIDDAGGNVSAAMQFDFALSRGDKKDVFVVLPFYDKSLDLKGKNPAEAFDKLLSAVSAEWEEKVNHVKVNIPEKEIFNTVRSNLAYILINRDGPAIQPGSRTYERSWIRDGSMTSAAMLRMGLRKEVKDYINWYAGYLYPNGKVPAVVDKRGADPFNEYDSQGQYIFALAEYYRFTKDKQFLKEKLPSIMKVLKYAEELRSRRTTPEFRDGPDEKKIFYGLFPESASHEGYCDKPMHSYWDDFYGLKGWKDAKMIAEVLGRDALAQRCQKEYESFKKAVYDSIRLVMKLKGINYIPGCAEKGDFDATSTAIAIMLCDEMKNLPQPQGKNTFDRYYGDLQKRFKPGWEGSFTPYEIRTAQAWVYMNEKEKALKNIRYMLGCRRPLAWNHLAEVVYFPYRKPLYIGDMPHTWVGSGYINTIRSLFVYEKGKNLILAKGVDDKWLSSKEGISIEDFPTYFGKVSYSIKKQGNKLYVKFWGDAVPPEGFVFVSPLPVKSVALNGKAWKDFSGNEVRFPRVPATMKIKCRKPK